MGGKVVEINTSAHLLPLISASFLTASDVCEYTREEVVRLTRVAAALSLTNDDDPLPIISVDKANVMATSRLWRQVVTETIRGEYPQLVDKLSHHLVDSAAMVLARDPRKLNGVVLTENVSSV